MNRRRNPFPGVTRAKSRHGKVMWRFRMAGRASCYLPGEYGSIAFRQAYESALAGKPLAVDSVRSAERGSFDWLIERYLTSPKYQKLKPITQRNRALEIERFRKDHGARMFADLKGKHVEAIIAKKASTPAAANKLLKLMRLLCRFAVKNEWLDRDPTFGVERYAENADGYYTWTEADIAQFEAFHGLGSKAVLALRLMLATGASRQDVARLGWQNIKAGSIEYRRGKTGEAHSGSLEFAPELQAALKLADRDSLLFITHGNGRGYSANAFGNWFKDQCKAAGLPQCTAHGLRKAGATRLANAEATEFEVQAYLAHKTPDEARTYVKAADRNRLTNSGNKKRLNASNPVVRLGKRNSNPL